MDYNRRTRRPELPDVILQHIQSFLKPNEAAQTMLISKSWLRAWSTRPFLFFSSYRPLLSNRSGYVDVVDRTLTSYVDRGLTILKFHLDFALVQTRWLEILRQTNVVELHLRARTNWTHSLFQQIFLTESLQVLTIVYGRFLLENIYPIKCLNLKKLELRQLHISEVIFHHIISSCPLIEELQLENCDLIENNLGIQSSMFTGECASLKRLSLFHTEINDEQLQTITAKSPHLEDLNLICCTKLVNPINLSSHSLKRINMDRNDVLLDLTDAAASNLLKLKFNSGMYLKIPFPITITSPITKGTVQVSIVYKNEEIDKRWLVGLREFLTKFAKSTVEFTVGYGWPLWFNFKVLRATPLPSWCEVEILRLSGYNDFGYKDLPILYAFFTICHPKIVLLGHLDSKSKHKLLTKLFKDISYKGNLECCNFDNEKKCWRHYLKDAKLYYVVNNEKKPLYMNGLETGLGSQKLINLALEW